jgi:hypothetical protein
VVTISFICFFTQKTLKKKNKKKKSKKIFFENFFYVNKKPAELQPKDIIKNLVNGFLYIKTLLP